MAGIGLINNPNSRRNRRYPDKMWRLRDALGGIGYSVVTESIPALKATLSEFKADAIDILVVNGGDGTVHATLTELIHIYGSKPLPKIALLGGGTMNIVANAVTGKGSLLRSAAGSPNDIAMGSPSLCAKSNFCE